MKKQRSIRVVRGEQFFSKSLFPFHMDRYLIKKNSQIVSHTHDFFELVYVLEGNAVHQVEDQVYQLATGNVFFLEPDVCHHFNASRDLDTVVFNILFSKEFLNEELSLLSSRPYFTNFFYLLPFLRKSSSIAPYLPLDSLQRLQIEQQLDTIYKEYQKKEDGYQIIIKTRLIETLILLSRFYTAGKSKDTTPLRDEEMIDSIARFLKEHCSQPITLVQLSQIYGLSVSSLTAKFKYHTGRTLIDYKHSLQIDQACIELRDQEKKIFAIALDCGFNDLSHFNRIFKKHTGTTPGNYRVKLFNQEG
jgi:AraC-like DNA-binding protein